MQRIDRRALPPATREALAALAGSVARAGDPKREAARLWKGMSRTTRESLKSVLGEMSTGLERCMYCEDGQGTDIEHFRPKSEYPADTFEWPNHLLACSHCNSNQKRNRFPLDQGGAPLLLDPTADAPERHLALSPTTGIYVALDARGEATIEVCGLNRQVCIAGRQDAWITLEQLVVGYANLRDQGRKSDAGKILRAIRRQPFQSVRVHMVSAIRRACSPELVVKVVVLRAFERFPELADNE